MKTREHAEHAEAGGQNESNRPQKNLKRITITIPVETDHWLKDFLRPMGGNKSAFIAQLVAREKRLSEMRGEAEKDEAQRLARERISIPSPEPKLPINSDSAREFRQKKK